MMDAIESPSFSDIVLTFDITSDSMSVQILSRAIELFSELTFWGIAFASATSPFTTGTASPPESPLSSEDIASSLIFFAIFDKIQLLHINLQLYEKDIRQ